MTSLRSRLVLVVTGLLALGLSAALGGTLAAVHDWRTDVEEGVLAAVAGDLEPFPADAAAAAPGALLAGSAARGDVPSFAQLRSARGDVLRTFTTGAAPGVGAVPPAGLLPHEPTPEVPDGARFVQVPPRTGDEGRAWLVRSSWTAGGDVVLVGMRAGGSGELERRVRNAALTSMGVALAAVALLSLHAVRRALRPLDEIARTAAEIGAGDTSRRVPSSDRPAEVARLADALNAMLARLESALDARAASEATLRRFVADASHELRTPITTIRGYAELFRRGAGDDPAELPKVMSRIESEAARVGDLVDELVLLARLDERRPLDREEVDLVRLASDAVMDARAADPDRVLELDADGGAVVVGDQARLRQVLANLLANVTQHTPPGTRATVRVRASGGTATVEVADDGPGLAPEQRAQVFERFYRADEGRSRSSGGAGLGLSIVAAIAHAHGGSAGVRERAGGGVVLEVRLPVGVPEEDEPGGPAVPGRNSAFTP